MPTTWDLMHVYIPEALRIVAIAGAGSAVATLAWRAIVPARDV